MNAHAKPAPRNALAPPDAGEARLRLDAGEATPDDEPTFSMLMMQTVRMGERYVRAHPFKSVGVAFGAGLVLSAVAKRGVLRVALLIATEKLTQVALGGIKKRARTDN